MRLAALLALLTGCGGAASAPPARAVEVARPATSADEPAPSPPPRAGVESERERRVATCLAAPWKASDPKLGPKSPSPATTERLEVLEKECRDTHPELGPGRFADPVAIPPSECHYGIARIYFEDQRYPEAARWFYRVATENSTEDIGVFAAQLYLESLNVLSVHADPPRTECAVLLRADAARFACTYCGRPDIGDACEIMRRVAGPDAESCAR